MTWVELDEVKQEGGIGVGSNGMISETRDDDLLTRLINAAQARLEKDTDRKFDVSANTTRYFRIGDSVIDRTLWLDRDLCAINSITNGNGDTISSDQYVTEPRNYAADGVPIYGITLKASSGAVWQWASDADGDQIAISGKWGYSASPDEDCKETLIQLVLWVYRLRNSQQSDNDRPIVTGDGTVLLPMQMPQFVKEFVARRRFKAVRY